MDHEFERLIETDYKNSNPLTLQELKTRIGKAVVIMSLQKWLTVNEKCKDVQISRILYLTRGKINAKNTDLPLLWNESNYGIYWIAYDNV